MHGLEVVPHTSVSRRTATCLTLSLYYIYRHYQAKTLDKNKIVLSRYYIRVYVAAGCPRDPKSLWGKGLGKKPWVIATEGLSSTPPKRDGQAVHSSSEGNISSQHVGHVPEMRSSRWSASSSGRAFWINSPCCQATNFSRSTWRSVTFWQRRQGTATTEVMVNMYCVPPFIPQNTTFFREQGDGLYWAPEQGIEPCTHGQCLASAWESGKGYQIVSRPRIVSPIPSKVSPQCNRFRW